MRSPVLAILIASCAATADPVDRELAGEYVYEFSRFARMNLHLDLDGTYLLTWDGCNGFSVKSQGEWSATGWTVEIVGGVPPIEDFCLRDLTVNDDEGTIVLRSSIGAEFRRVVPCRGCDDGTLGLCFSCGHLRCGTLGVEAASARRFPAAGPGR